MERGAKWRPAVVAFADLMEARLAELDGRRGGETWGSVADPMELVDRAAHNVLELGFKVGRWQAPGLWDGKPDEAAIIRQAANVANLAMMVADRCGPLVGSGGYDSDADFDIVPMPERKDMHMFVALPAYRRNNESIFLRLLLTSADVDEETVAGWSDEQAKEADLWAVSVHLNASDNDDIYVPPTPAFVPMLATAFRPGRHPITGAPE